jgi:hypothetical protein
MLHCSCIRHDRKFRSDSVSNGEVDGGRTFCWRMEESEPAFPKKIFGALYHWFPFPGSPPQFSVEPEKETWMRRKSTWSLEVLYADKQLYSSQNITTASKYRNLRGKWTIERTRRMRRLFKIIFYIYRKQKAVNRVVFKWILKVCEDAT